MLILWIMQFMETGPRMVRFLLLAINLVQSVFMAIKMKHINSKQHVCSSSSSMIVNVKMIIHLRRLLQSQLFVVTIWHHMKFNQSNF